MPIKRSQRKALSAMIAMGSLNISTIGVLSTKLDEFPEAITPKEYEYLEKLRSRVHQDSVLMLKFAHKLRKPSNV